ncbi:mechanosensitive ion channel domain-containing protein [Pseudofulvimonas gallinarii]|jgi:potassium efflux system protein|uniref:Potassium efflux system protein n=1 Tax=Pseudofulvimonas gallinarii TaxID=634155 RepID=A0A4S3L0N7_9GAMM|nr:mechanosensitive ion channel domain-containing protein [Pseudofulvimonas gallinarii]TCS99676.1 potassium efflux system protein [Pseudofulvimonas gallinarii]THD15285.1 hypothetical protein B1808_00300 [Pseudofulvimonas gallinarii]
MTLSIRLILACAFLLVATPARAAPTPAELDQAQQALERAGDLQATQKDAARQKLELAREALNSAAEVRERVAERKASLAARPEQERTLQRSLAVDNDGDMRAWLARLPTEADTEALELLLDQERRTIAALRSEQERIAAELARLLSQPVQAGESQAALRQQIDSLSAPQGAVTGESDVVAEVRRLKREADVDLLQAQLEESSLAQEASRSEQALLELRLREVRHRLARHELRLPVLQERITARARAALTARLEALRDQYARLRDENGLGAHLAQGNVELGEELLAASEILDRERAEADSAAQATEQLRTALRDTRTRLELGGGSAQVGQWLWQERIRLPAQPRLRAQLGELRSTLADLRVRLIEVNEQQRSLSYIDATLGTMLAEFRSQAEESGGAEGDRGTARTLLAQRGGLVAQLDSLLRRRITTLEQMETALVAQRADAQSLQNVLDRNLLWTPSHAPASASWLARVPDGIHDLVKPSRLATTADLVRRSFAQRPTDYVLSIVAVLVLLLLRRSAPARLEVLGAHTRQLRSDRFRYTLVALAVTLLAALPLAAALFLFGQLLQNVGAAGKFSDSLGIAMVMTSVPALLFAWLRWLVIDKGVAQAHFRWTRARRQAISGGLRWSAPLALVAIFVIALAFTRNQALAIDVQARLAIILLALLGAGWSWRALDAEQVWSPRGIDASTSPLRRGARLLLPALCLVVAGLALLGYVYSAAVLVRALVSSISVIVLVATLVATIGRWFLVSERRLALHRREQKRQAQDDEQALLVEAEADITLETVNAHTRRILRALRLSLLGVGLVWVWSDVLPAFARLDDITVWSFHQTGSDGGVVDMPVSLLALLGGALVLVLTTIAARNLPGLMELGLLSRSRIDAASRYAITSLFRYAIVIVGVMVGLGLFGLRWSQLQWMAAALTVGLGFGLQEIFANFVSGLILLFERPFRVGDTITVGGKTGTVTRIRTRATTLRDGEGREIFIPNKSFITGELTNWSLSDNPTTAIIEYGVAYGSDIPVVHEVALQAARENPRVLREPAPVSAFKSFEGNVMTFELKVFLAALGDRVPARSELALRLTSLLRERGIQMSPSQMDINIRSLPAPEAPRDPAG